MSHSIHYPDGNVLLRNLNKDYPVISHGQGVHLFDLNGKKYFDGSGGALVVSLGHGNEDLAKRIFDQMKKVAYVNGTQFTSEPLEKAATNLASKAQALHLDKVSFLASGSEAVEAAIKFTRQLWFDRGKPGKHKLITRAPGYHGNTLYALSASARPHYKSVYGPLLSEVLTVSAPYGYRCPVDYERDGAEYYANELETLILKEGANSISAFILEPVSGSSTGAWAPPKNYAKRVNEICKKHDILIIADEVMCGAGRTGNFYASETIGLMPDVIVLGKGLNSGLMPVSAIIVKSRDVDTMKAGSQGFLHAQTYMQAPSMAATALAVLEFLDEHKVLETARAVSRHWLTRLKSEILPLPFIGSVTGVGHMAGVEFVEDKTSKKPFPIAKKFAQKFVTHAQEQGLILWPNYGQADGVNGDLVMLGPSLLMTLEEADECIALLKNAVQGFKIL